MEVLIFIFFGAPILLGLLFMLLGAPAVFSEYRKNVEEAKKAKQANESDGQPGDPGRGGDT